ncbi:transcriptional regulator [Paraburkholderia caledonica]
MAPKTTEISRPQALPLNGCSRWADLEPFIPVGRETWRKLCLSGRAPKPVKLSLRCTVWNNAEVHRWLVDPTGYSAASADTQAA